MNYKNILIGLSLLAVPLISWCAAREGNRLPVPPGCVLVRNPTNFKFSIVDLLNHEAEEKVLARKTNLFLSAKRNTDNEARVLIEFDNGEEQLSRSFVVGQNSSGISIDGFGWSYCGFGYPYFEVSQIEQVSDTGHYGTHED